MKEFNYARQSHAPDWYDRTNHLHVAATSGTSPFNEWYGFQSEQDAHDMACRFKSQSFIDEFVNIEGRFYHSEDVMWDRDDTPLSEKTPACLQRMVDAESSF